MKSTGLVRPAITVQYRLIVLVTLQVILTVQAKSTSYTTGDINSTD